ncbi:MAG: DUF108 domain-containing protein [Candidatus Omnitrophica bacterium]|nr:DUF108 domain-containing protein [Candidatus Omnitrophota bacterium]
MVRKNKVKVGIIGCGAIGSRVAQSLFKDLKDDCQLAGIFDVDAQKVQKLAQSLLVKNVVKPSIKELIKSADLIIESINTTQARDIVQQVLKAKKNVLVMSIGQMLNAENLFELAKKNNCRILIPSGAIAGVDAIKAGHLVKFSFLTHTTRKPLAGFKNDPYLLKKGIDVSQITQETVLFDGTVDQAVKAFPRNINVAATLSLACQNKKKVRVKIITSPEYKENSHEIEMVGDFGRILTKTVNVVCPDNPKTSYLAVLSVIQTIKQFCSGVFIGT